MVELLVVLAVILFVSLTAVTGYANLRRSRSVRQAAEAIQAVFVSARAYAITTNGYYRVVFQMQDPATGAEQTTFWIDEIYRNTNLDPSPSAVDVTRDVKTAKITTPERLPEGVSLAELLITPSVTHAGNGVPTPVLPTSDSYAVIRFFPEGSSDEATVRLIREGGSTAATNPQAYTVRLAAPTAKPRIISEELR